MLIKRNIANFRRGDLIPLRQQEDIIEIEQSNHFTGCPTATLNPQFPLSSVLLAEDKFTLIPNQLLKQQSQFSFKERKLLNEEMPVKFQEVIDPYEITQSNKKVEQFVKFDRMTPKKRFTCSQSRQKGSIKKKRDIGKLVLSKRHVDEQRQIQQESEKSLKKTTPLSTGISKLYSNTLNKIKQLKINDIRQNIKQQVEKKQSNRYSINKDIKQSNSKIQTTDTSRQQSNPIKNMIFNIKKHVENLNISITKQNKKIIPKQDQDQQTHLILNQFYCNNIKQIKKSQQLLDIKNKSFLVRSTNKKILKSSNKIQNVIISYKTSILQLKQICFNYDPSINIKFKIPQIFSQSIFDQSDDQQELFSKASQLLKDLDINSTQIMTIRKYNNCVIIMVQNISIITYFTGHVYFGQWHHGKKHGLGFEWSPNHFVYYGQFNNNKREGYGVLKDFQGEVVLGKWKDNKILKNDFRQYF